MRMLLPCVLALWPCLAAGQTAPIAQAIRAADWPAAQADAASMADPLAAKLVLFFRLLHPGDGRAAEIAAFMHDNPDWPSAPMLLRRRDEALATEADDAVVLPLCAGSAALAPRSGPAWARCAEAEQAAGQRDDAVRAARAAAIAGFPDADTQARFMQRWAAVLTPADQLARFDALLGTDPAAAVSQAARLAPADERLARARLAVRAGDPQAAKLVAALPPAQRDTPALVLDQLRQLRRKDDTAAALALWSAHGPAAELAGGAATAAAFWTERAALARRLLRTGDAAAAYRLADDSSQTDAEPEADSAFLSGFVALRGLHQPHVAASQFRLLERSTAAISQARAHYWLGRAAAAQQDMAGARREYQAAAAWPTTYYGQLAILADGGDAKTLNALIAGLGDPAWTQAQALQFAGGVLVRAASLLVAWGEPGRARVFLQQATAHLTDAAARSMAAHFAQSLALPDQAVAVARRAGRDGTVLAQAGWPAPFNPPERPVSASVSLGIMRQESSFDAAAVSPAGARGLMQLLPGTANMVSQQLGTTVPPHALTADPAANMRLGSLYVGQLLDRFGGSLPLAIAAYNAGPSRVQQWLESAPDPRGHGAEAMIDWIELIPFSETRNYVQRVIENIAVYRARRGEAQPYPVSA